MKWVTMNSKDNANQEFIYSLLYGRHGEFTISNTSPTTWSAKLVYTNKRYEKAVLTVTDKLSFSEALQGIADLFVEAEKEIARDHGLA
jgi:hypothetical protein